MDKMLLIIDDAKLIRDELKSAITAKTGFDNFLEAESVKTAIELLNRNKPEFIIIDLALPDGSGFEILEEVRKTLPQSKSIVLTNYPYEQFKEKALQMGADYFFDKSSEFLKVIDIISNYIMQPKEKLFDSENKMLKVLVVDDSNIMRKMVIASLKALDNVSFVEANSGLEAIEILAVSKIDAVILDLNMPDMHGLEVLSFIRNHNIFKDLPVVILTTRSDQESKLNALNAGATIYITKPFNPNELIEKIKSVLRSR